MEAGARGCREARKGFPEKILDWLLRDECHEQGLAKY